MKNKKNLKTLPTPLKRNIEDFKVPQETKKGIVFIRQYKCPHCSLPIYSDQKIKSGVWGEIHRHGHGPAYLKSTVHKHCVEDYQNNFINELFIDLKALDNFVDLLTRTNEVKTMEKQIFELTEANSKLSKQINRLKKVRGEVEIGSRRTN